MSHPHFSKRHVLERGAASSLRNCYEAVHIYGTSLNMVGLYKERVTRFERSNLSAEVTHRVASEMWAYRQILVLLERRFV